MSISTALFPLPSASMCFRNSYLVSALSLLVSIILTCALRIAHCALVLSFIPDQVGFALPCLPISQIIR